MDPVLSKRRPRGETAWWKGLASAKSEPAVERRPLPRPAVGEVRHAELFASSRQAGGAGLALAFALEQAEADDQRPWLWVQDAAALRLGGRPYRPGLPRMLRHRLLHVAAKTPEDALFALEEGLRCRDLAFVIGEIAGNPKALSFTASRRLSLVAETHGVPLWLVRLDALRDLSSARQRWQVTAAPSLAPRWNKAAPGAPAWHAELFRARNHPPGEWILHALRDGLSASGLDPSSGQSEVRESVRSW